MVQLTAEQVTAMMEEIRPSVVEDLKKELLQAVDWSAKNAIQAVVQREIVAWAEQEIVPALKEKLAESKDGILAAVVPAANGIAEELAKALLLKLRENLKGYRSSEILSGLFK